MVGSFAGPESVPVEFTAGSARLACGHAIGSIPWGECGGRTTSSSRNFVTASKCHCAWATKLWRIQRRLRPKDLAWWIPRLEHLATWWLDSWKAWALTARSLHLKLRSWIPPKLPHSRGCWHWRTPGQSRRSYRQSLRTHLRVESDAPLRWRRKWMLRLVVSPLKRIMLNLRKSLSGADEDKEAAAMKRPASKAVVPAGINTKRPAANIKRPAAADVEDATPAHPKKAKKDLPATVTVLKRPASKSASKPAASVARASAEERSNLLREIPLAVRKQYANGCATCRYRPGCCVSCWRKRGY